MAILERAQLVGWGVCVARLDELGGPQQTSDVIGAKRVRHGTSGKQKGSVARAGR
jgi:hypothetical protein